MRTQDAGASAKINHLHIRFDGIPANESFARVSVSAFMSQLSPTLEEINDVKTAVSEAVTNAVVHGYKNAKGEVQVDVTLYRDGRVVIDVSDEGCGIDDIGQAMTPFYTSQPEMERAGMGFAVMQTFMDDVRVTSKIGFGTSVYMVKKVKGAAK